MTKKNILELCLSPDLGGLELYLFSCVQNMKEDFNITAVINEDSKLVSYFLESKGKYHKLKRKSSFSLLTAYKLAKIIDEYKIDILHLHWTKDIPIAVFAKLLSKRNPRIVQTRHMTMTRFKDDFYHRFLYKNIDTIICVTKELSLQLNKFIAKDIRPSIVVLYLGAKDYIKESSQSISEYKKNLGIEDEMLIGLVGRINVFKGQYLLIEALKEIKEKELKIKALIVGSAMSEGYLDSLKNKIKEYELNNYVKFLGFSNEANKFMQACDVVLMTSKNETFGLVSIEAMQTGTCVIGADSGGVLEIIDDKVNGLLFKSEDSNDLSSKIQYLYENKELRISLGKKAEEKVNECFNNKIQFDKLIKIFDNI